MIEPFLAVLIAILLLARDEAIELVWWIITRIFR